jgi:hypothetical protein
VTGPQKRLVEIGCLGDLKEGSTAIRYVGEGDILKVKMVITAEQKAEWPEIKAKIRGWGEAHGYLIHVVQPVLLESLRSRTGKKQPQRAQQSDEDLLRTYAKHHTIDALTLKAGINLLRKV